jgi:hypothetical protein
MVLFPNGMCLVVNDEIVVEETDRQDFLRNI